jgi:hypothetical protein
MLPPQLPQSSSRIIIQQQLLLLSPQPPFPLKSEVPPPQQQERSRMIQIRLLHPLSELHPQFVAAKSLISDLP